MRSTCFVLLALALGCATEPATSVEGTDTAAPDTAPSTSGCEVLADACVKQLKGCVGASGDDEARCEPCPFGSAPEGPLAQCATIAGEKLSHEFDPVQLQAGQELDGVCQSWRLDNDTELWVNAVEFEQDGGYHHSNWFFVPESADYPDEYPWFDCYVGGFHELQAALDGGVLFAQSTQVIRELQRFPQGVAVRIPPRSRIIGATHLLNVFGEEATTTNRMNLYVIPTAQVTTALTPFRLSYRSLDIPAQTESAVEAECDIAESFEKILKQDMALKLYYALPHFHNLGTGFSLSIYGGPRDGEVLFDQGGFGADPFGRMFDPPVDLAGARGLRFRCSYQNPRPDRVGYGIGDQEMCVMLGFAESKLAFDASVTANTGESTVDGKPVTTGACKVSAFPFSQTK